MLQYFLHRYTSEIPEPASSLSRHGAQIEGLQVFPIIKIIVIRQMPMLTCMRGLGVKTNMRKTLYQTQRL